MNLVCIPLHPAEHGERDGLVEPGLDLGRQPVYVRPVQSAPGGDAVKIVLGRGIACAGKFSRPAVLVQAKIHVDGDTALGGVADLRGDLARFPPAAVISPGGDLYCARALRSREVVDVHVVYDAHVAQRAGRCRHGRFPAHEGAGGGRQSQQHGQDDGYYAVPVARQHGYALAELSGLRGHGSGDGRDARPLAGQAYQRAAIARALGLAQTLYRSLVTGQLAVAL